MININKNKDNSSNNSKQIISDTSINNTSSNSIKDIFRTPLTPLHRGGLRGLHWFGLDRFCDNTLRYAFSLIELSIVLIIIGLLVAGVTGGKSLIESAKLNTIIQESRDYRLAFNEAYMNNPNIASDTISERPTIILNSVGENKIRTIKGIRDAAGVYP